MKEYKFSTPVIQKIVGVLQDCLLQTEGVSAMDLFDIRLMEHQDTGKLFLVPPLALTTTQSFSLSKEVVERIGQMLGEISITTNSLDTLLMMLRMSVDETDGRTLVLEPEYKKFCEEVFATMLTEKTKIVEKMAKTVN